LSDTSLPPAGARRGLMESVLGGAVALVAITVAHASLPDPRAAVASRPLLARPAAPVVARSTAAPAPAPVLIAFDQPLPDGEVGSPFGLRQLPWEAHARLHAGVDLIAPAPEPVLAAADGVVVRVGTDAGYGRFVELKHAEGLSTLYGHLDRFAPGVAVGVALKAGSPVGRLGSTGTSTGLHLHFEIHDRDGRPMNPELFVGRSFARAEDLPLKQARRTPRGVRVAYVSRIPRSKQAAMQAKEEGEIEQAADDAGQVSHPMANLDVRRSHGRVHARLRL
jgi:murein DD-endopeptidase MepM/ murein hydrolase activator NlpD